MARKRGNDEGNKSPSWLTTYGDMMSLLLIFFIFLFSFSNIDAQKFKAMVASLQASLGVLEGGRSMSSAPATGGDVGQDLEQRTNEPQDEFEALYEDMQRYIQQNNISATVEMTENKMEILLRFKDNVLFESGKADIIPSALPVLNNIAGVLKTYQEQIGGVRIEGHTDNVPIHTVMFPSNWELSTARAVTVLRYFVEQQRLPPEMLSAVGYGEYHPVATNDTIEGRAKNRRVDIVITRTWIPEEINSNINPQ
ncbi:OmpA family protein [Mahella sp.]|uniref:OmpA/MotB family protein n=1 Tax=Mahella sp. TaxID=2798721 RepID=UPI0025C56FAF|nr:OmpA family protein [Mahella sp.]MBZ4666231.1 OmpA/MotB domain protein [Mahella sp.]